MLSYKEYIDQVNSIIDKRVTYYEEGIEIRLYNHDKDSAEYVVVDPFTKQEITLESANCVDDVRGFIRKNYLNQ